MIKEIPSFAEYEGFINELARAPIYYDPHFTYSKENLYRSLKREGEYAFVVLGNGVAEGLFIWLVLPEDRYIEMIIGFTREEKAFAEMLSYMEQNYYGYTGRHQYNDSHAVGPFEHQTHDHGHHGNPG